MRNVIITGATSFIGSSLIKELIKEDVRIFAVVRPNSKNIKNLPNSVKITIIELEMKNYTELDKKIKISCDTFFSLAWDGTRGAERNNVLIQKENFKNSIDGLKAGIKLGCKKIIFSGSQAEYGLYSTEIYETFKSRPDTEYGKYKLQFYEKAKEICLKSKVSFKEARFFSVYGIDDNENTLVISILKKMVKNEMCDLTECKQIWNFLNINDAVSGLMSLMEVNCEDGIYNIGNEVSKPLREYIEEMYSLVGSTSKLNFGKIPYPENRIINLSPNVEKLKKNCNWLPCIEFKTGIKEIINMLKGGDHEEN